MEMKFDQSFYLEEERCGYVITEKQKKVWAVQLDLLNKLLSVCNRHGIIIHVTGGTLLGAIRHHGYIPWDDDIDVQITRSNYIKLLKFADEFKYPYFLQTSETDKRYYIEYARLRNSETTAIVTGMDDPNYNSGIYIDISVYDACPDNDRLIRNQIICCKITKTLCDLYYDDYRKRKGWKKAISFLLANTLFKLLPYKYFVSKNERAIRKYEGKTIYVSAMFVGSVKRVKKLRCIEDELNEQKYVKFEMLDVPIWPTYEDYLLAMYGDYMQYPPIQERGKWHEGIIVFDPDIPYKDYLHKRKG